MATAAAVSLAAVLLLAGPSHAIGCPSVQEMASGTTVQGGTACYKSGEQRSGANRICYYRCPTGTAAITVSAMQPCPITIRR